MGLFHCLKKENQMKYILHYACFTLSKHISTPGQQFAAFVITMALRNAKILPRTLATKTLDKRLIWHCKARNHDNTTHDHASCVQCIEWSSPLLWSVLV